jgi:hypothetical protein
VPSRITQIGVAACFVLAAAGVFTSSVVAVGCGTQCDRNPDDPPVLYTEGTTTNPGTPSAFYETSPQEGPYLPFPPGRTYRFTHGLGGPPRHWEADIAFNPSPVATTDGGRARGGTARCAGNQCTLERTTDTVLEIRNDTCSDVWLRVTASHPRLGTADGMPDSGAPPLPEPDAAPAP